MERRFERSVEVLPAIFELAGEFCASEQIDDRTRWVIEFTLEELFTNVVRHNPGRAGKVRIALARNGDAVQIAVTDPDSDGFDPTRVPAPNLDAPLEERLPGGLGIHLVKTMTDTIRYEFKDGVSTTVVTKKLVRE